MQENQGTKVWTGASICEGRLPTDTPNSERFVSLSTDAVKESLPITDSRSTPGVVLGRVSPKDKPCSVVGHNDSGSLLVTAAVEGGCSEAVDAGLVKEVESGVAEERQQIVLLMFGQTGCDCRHDGGQAGTKSPEDEGRVEEE